MEGAGYAPECSHRMPCKLRVVSILRRPRRRDLPKFRRLGPQHAVGQCFPLLYVALDPKLLAGLSTSAPYATARRATPGVESAKLGLCDQQGDMMPESNPNDWKVEGLRHSTFVREPLTIPDFSPWQSLLGTPPTERSTKPMEQLVKEEGSYLDGWLSVEARTKRIDWRLGLNPGNIPQSLPVIGAYNEIQKNFLSLMKKWSSTCPPTHRLAYGAVLLLSRDSLQDVYSTLNDFLNDVTIDPMNTRDFMYRINKRRTSKRSGPPIQINRLSTWSLVEISRIDIDISSRKTITVGDVADGKLCRLELDINTAPEYQGPISSEEAVMLTEELFDLAAEIATKGDVG